MYFPSAFGVTPVVRYGTVESDITICIIQTIYRQPKKKTVCLPSLTSLLVSHSIWSSKVCFLILCTNMGCGFFVSNLAQFYCHPLTCINYSPSCLIISPDFCHVAVKQLGLPPWFAFPLYISKNILIIEQYLLNLRVYLCRVFSHFPLLPLWPRIFLGLLSRQSVFRPKIKSKNLLGTSFFFLIPDQKRPEVVSLSFM